MEIDNKLKTKAPEEELNDALTTKKARLEEEEEEKVVTPVDPLFEVTDDEIRQIVSDWFDACDPSLRLQHFGWGGQMVVKNYIKSQKIKSCAEYYKDKPATLLESDKALCEEICNLHVFHIAAKEWGDRPDICYGSYETQLFLFVIKHNLILKKESVSMEKFVHRLMELSGQYSHPYDHYSEEDADGKRIMKKKESVMTEIPKAQQASFAIFFFPNLQFLFKREGVDRYVLSTEDIKRGHDSFCEAIQQVNPLIRVNCVSFDWSHKVAGQKALDHALERYHFYLKCKSFIVLEFNKKPLSIVQVTAFQATF